MKYRTIVADPPWQMPSGGQRTGFRQPGSPSLLPYEAMKVGQMASLPVVDLAEHDAHLYLWTINAFVEPSYKLARRWGFRPVTLLTWCKTPRGLGPGGAFAQTSEFVLFCRRGQLRANHRVDTTWWNWKRPHNNHSAKPEAFLDLVESVSPGPYLEMFARRNRLGWDTFGDESLPHVELLA